MIIALLLALVLGGHVAPIARPNPRYTWGVTRPLSRKTVCETRWGRDVRHVSEKMRRAVFAAYGIPYAQRARFELDHLIPRSLAGDDNVHNLWPQPLWQARHQKDVLEVKLGQMVCTGEVTLPFAQEAIRRDWVAAYRLYVTPTLVQHDASDLRKGEAVQRH